MKTILFSLASSAVVSVVLAGGEGGGDKCEPVTVYSTVQQWQDVEEKTVYLTSTVKEVQTTTEVQWQTDYVTITTVDVQVKTETVTDTVEVTGYVTITNTDVQLAPTTVVDTVTAVDTITAVDTVTVSVIETQPESYTETQVRTDISTVTSTVFEEDTTTVTAEGPTITVSDCPTTEPLTGLVLCPSRIVNPTYTPKKPLPTNYLWGCPPGKICTPPQIGCNFERSPPREEYVCAPEECKPVPEIPDYVNTSWPSRTDANCAWYKPAPGFFNLNPYDFGLTYAIFDIYGQPRCDDSSPSQDWGDSAWGDSEAPKGKPPRGRRDRNSDRAALVPRQGSDQIQYAPQPCWNVYNGAEQLAEAGPRDYSIICEAGTAFQDAVGECKDCKANQSQDPNPRPYPTIQSQLNWCSDQPEATPSP